MLMDLGFEMAHMDDVTKVQDFIRLVGEVVWFKIRDIANFILNRELDRQFDLVLILEHFDESLILLQNLMCWSTEDLVYLKQNERISKESFLMC